MKMLREILLKTLLVDILLALHVMAALAVFQGIPLQTVA